MRHGFSYLLPSLHSAGYSARPNFDDNPLDCNSQGQTDFSLACSLLPEDMPEANFPFKTRMMPGAEPGILFDAVNQVPCGKRGKRKTMQVSLHNVPGKAKSSRWVLH